MRLFTFALPLCLIALLTTSCITNPDIVNATIVQPCHQAELGPVLCTVQLTNSPTSSDAFKWTASSDVSGVIFVPASNTSPGISVKDSQTVAVSIPAGSCPAKLTFTDDTTHTSTSVTFGNPCSTPAPISVP